MTGQHHAPAALFPEMLFGIRWWLGGPQRRFRRFWGREKSLTPARIRTPGHSTRSLVTVLTTNIQRSAHRLRARAFFVWIAEQRIIWHNALHLRKLGSVFNTPCERHGCAGVLANRAGVCCRAVGWELSLVLAVRSSKLLIVAARDLGSRTGAT